MNEPSAALDPGETTSIATDEGGLAHEIRIFDAEGREHSLASMLDVLAERRVVLLGETHLDDVTHRVELAVLEGLADRRGDRVVLSMEMFERDVQGVLDRYVAGKIDETEFLAEARPWGNYRTGYRPLVELARERGLFVVAANTPRAVLRGAASGAEGYDKARAEHPGWLPERIFGASDAYWARVDRTIRGHGPPRGGDRSYSVQNLWDNTMADAIVQAAEAHAEHQVLHVVGGFHVEQHDGTVAQVRRRAPKLELATVSVVPSFDLARVEAAPERADFVVYAQAYAEGFSGDQLAVSVPAELSYRLHVPDGPAPEGGWPMLVWLADDDERTEDSVLRWQLALGEEAIVAVVEPPEQTRAREGWLVRRWSWPESQGESWSAVSVGLGRLVEYARRRLAVRGGPVLVAGEGAGGSVVLWATQYGAGWEGVEVLAIEPELPRALRTAAIPEEESAVEKVKVLGEVDDGTRAGLKGAGLEVGVAEAPGHGVPRDLAVRRALGLGVEDGAGRTPPSPDVAAPMAVDGRALEVHVAQPSAVLRRWAALYVAVLRQRGHDARLVLGDSPRTKGTPRLEFDGEPAQQVALLRGVFAEGKGLPRPPDAFGGAVVLLVPRSAPRESVKTWAEILAKTEAAQGFFKTPYRVVREGSKELAGVFKELREKGRTEVLVVPAELCAAGDRMQRYVDAVEPKTEGLSLHWLPGLGHDVVVKLANSRE